MAGFDSATGYLVVSPKRRYPDEKTNKTNENGRRRYYYCDAMNERCTHGRTHATG